MSVENWNLNSEAEVTISFSMLEGSALTLLTGVAKGADLGKKAQLSQVVAAITIITRKWGAVGYLCPFSGLKNEDLSRLA